MKKYLIMNNIFDSFTDFLNESKKEEQHFGCIMLYSNDFKDYKKLGETFIEPEDIYDDENNEYGIEKKCHVTILYGIHNDMINKKTLYDDMQKMKPISCLITEIDFFECDDYDVIKMNIPVSKQLLNYRKLFEDNYENTQTFKSYRPHATICYVKKGTGKKYKMKLEQPIELIFNEAVYSDHTYKKKYFKLK